MTEVLFFVFAPVLIAGFTAGAAYVGARITQRIANELAEAFEKYDG